MRRTLTPDEQRAFEAFDALEPSQLRAALRERLPRREIGPRIRALLWTLRIYVVIAIALVVYSFVRALHAA